MLVSAMHITAGVFVNDDESGLHADIWEWLEHLAPRREDYRHHRTGEDNGDAHLKSLLVHHEVIVPITAGRLDLGPVAARVLRRVRRPARQAHGRQGDGRVRARCVGLGGALLLAACAARPGPKASAPAPAVEDDAKRLAAFEAVEDEAMGWIAAADPRLATRAVEAGEAPATRAPRRSSSASARRRCSPRTRPRVIRGNSLDLFAFRARSRALDQAAQRVAAFGGALPEETPAPSACAAAARARAPRARHRGGAGARDRGGQARRRLGRPRARHRRDVDAARRPRTSGPLRDAWVSKHLLEIRDSLRAGSPPTGPLDLDAALYPLERLLAPLQFPRGSAAIAEVRMGLDQDMRAVPPLVVPERVVALETKVHLGRRRSTPRRSPRASRGPRRCLKDLAVAALEASGDAAPGASKRARGSSSSSSAPAPRCPARGCARWARRPSAPPSAASLRALSEEALASARRSSRCTTTCCSRPRRSRPPRRRAPACSRTRRTTSSTTSAACPASARPSRSASRSRPSSSTRRPAPTRDFAPGAPSARRRSTSSRASSASRSEGAPTSSSRSCRRREPRPRRPWPANFVASPVAQSEA